MQWMKRRLSDAGAGAAAVGRMVAAVGARAARLRVGWPFSLRSANARLFVMLLITLGGLAGALAWSIGYLNATSTGRELPLTGLLDLAANGRVVTATVHDFDHRVTGQYVVTPATASPSSSSAQNGTAGTATGTAPSTGATPSTGTPATGATSATGSARPQLGDYWVVLPGSDSETPLVIDHLSAGGAVVAVHHQLDKTIVQFMAQYILPLVLLANLFGLLFMMAHGGGSSLSGIIQFGRIGKRRQDRDGASRITFASIAGADEAVAELREVRDYLADPARFTAMGAQAPKGVLLCGPPGCGKTLMARAVAGEADVSFFSISGAEFVESLVGIGAARVRDLFRQVRKSAPAIIFIDELDAAGRRRGGSTGGQEERENTLNQLLVEMDGFEPTAGIVVIGATNRPDILDPALLRPGRFDRQVTVEAPDVDGRRDILELHASSRPVSPDIDWDSLARRTPGFTGADLANVVNEGSLLAVRFGKDEVGQEEFDEAVQRVLTGPRRRGHLLSADEKKRAAYHEAGHAVVLAAMGRLDAIQRVSILARGRAVGQTSMGKTLQERALLSRSELRGELVCSMGGVAAEELVMGEPSTGSEDDLEHANGLAELIVGRYGMSERLGKVQFVKFEGSAFLSSESVPKELTAGPVLMELHQEVRRLMDEAEASATDILVRHREVLTEVAERLVKRESLDTTELEALLEPVRPEMNLGAADIVEKPSRNGSHAVSAGRSARDLN